MDFVEFETDDGPTLVPLDKVLTIGPGPCVLPKDFWNREARPTTDANKTTIVFNRVSDGGADCARNERLVVRHNIETVRRCLTEAGHTVARCPK